MIVSRLPLWFIVALPLVFAACGGDSLTLPPEGAAARIEVMAVTNNQSARVGELLPRPLQVRVTDSRDRPVAGETVVFTIPEGAAAGLVDPGSSTTDADGYASTTVTLGSRAGTVTGTAAVEVAEGADPVQASFAALALADNANGIKLVSGNEQSGTVNSTLPAPLVVLVTDAGDNPIPGQTVEWSVAGGGSVSAASTVTGADGQTSVTRTLGGTAGQQTTLATAAGLAGSPVTFTHIATPGSAARVIVVDGNGQSAPAGTKLDKDLVVRLLDADNNPITGRPVSWVVGAGGGTASPETSTTDANGEARTEWTLGPTPGSNTLTAVVSGVGNGSFNAIGTKLESNTQITSHQPEPQLVGLPVTVSVTVEGEGGPPSGQVTVAGDGAVASCTITLSNGSGSCQITFAQPGNRDITATYGGDTRFSGSSDTERHQVEPAPIPNSPPTAAFTPPACTVNQPCPFSDQSTDSDGNIASRTWAFQDGVPAGSTDANPSITFASEGSKVVTLTVNDDDGATNSVTHNVTVSPPANTPPTANDDSDATPIDVPLSRPAGTLTANDSPPESGDIYSTSLLSYAGSGEVSVGSDGSFNYTPAPGFTGLDTFEYTLSDGRGGSDTAIMSITVGP